jgi:hypothetical protein
MSRTVSHKVQERHLNQHLTLILVSAEIIQARLLLLTQPFLTITFPAP